eukprot:333125-Pleurochrysis_carterae.AAC.1
MVSLRSLWSSAAGCLETRSWVFPLIPSLWGSPGSELPPVLNTKVVVNTHITYLVLQLGPLTVIAQLQAQREEQRAEQLGKEGARLMLDFSGVEVGGGRPATPGVKQSTDGTGFSRSRVSHRRRGHGAGGTAPGDGRRRTGGGGTSGVGGGYGHWRQAARGNCKGGGPTGSLRGARSGRIRASGERGCGGLEATAPGESRTVGSEMGQAHTGGMARNSAQADGHTRGSGRTQQRAAEVIPMGSEPP